MGQQTCGQNERKEAFFGRDHSRLAHASQCEKVEGFQFFTIYLFGVQRGEQNRQRQTIASNDARRGCRLLLS